jgi:putative ABC transport system permease protein
VEIGSKINVKIGDKFSPLTIIDVLPPADLAGGIINNLLVVDIATAQEVFEFYDGVDHLNLRIDDAEILSEINTLIDSGKLADIELVDLSAQASRIKRMTAAFYSNLTALSLMALLVGMFLIYNTETFLVLQRRAILGRLRALGVSRRQILIAILVEAAAIGTIGSLSGIALGILLANGLLGIVSTTINDLYFDAPIQSLSIDPTTLIVSLLIGVAATLFAALVPALDAIRMEPNLVISRTGLRPFKVRQICIVTSIVFVLCNLLAVVVLTHSQSPSAGFAGICLVVLGFAALCPMAIIALSSIARRLIGSSRLLPERLGLRTVSVTLNRTGTATAALMIATAASIGIGVMVTSFRVSVADWLDSALRAEVYIADGQFDNRFRDKKIPQLVIKKLEQLPEVIATSNVLRRQVYSAQERIQVSVFTLNSIAKRGFNHRH